MRIYDVNNMDSTQNIILGIIGYKINFVTYTFYNILFYLIHSLKN